MKPALVPAPTVITCHSNADWDALSSMIGMTMLYPDSVMVFPGSMEKPLNEFFNETASYLYPFKNPKEIDPATIRRVVVVDTQIRSRVPQVHDFLDLPGVEVQVRDYHPTPQPDEKGKVIRADVARIGDDRLHLHPHLSGAARRGRRPYLSGGDRPRARHLRRHRGLYLYLHPARGFPLRPRGCAATAWT